MKKVEFKRLVEKYLEGRASEREKDILFKYYDAMQDEDTIWDDSAMGSQEAVHKILYSRVLNDIDTRSNRSFPVNWVKIAAASLIILVSCGLLLFKNSNKEQIHLAVESHKGNIRPGGNKAYLTLANGKRIALTNTSNGTLIKQSGVRISKMADGQLVYTVVENKLIHPNAALEYNTIETPNGGQYEVILPDGTKVWLNAASSLKYPTLFTNNERKVELTGEAYFEVMQQNSKAGRIPFIVKINTQFGDGGEVEVLGTHFNIMAYKEEKNINTTLLKGSVRIKKGEYSEMLQPGQQAQIINGKNNNIKIIENANINEVMAWKNGMFEFNNADIETIIRQIARWYDVKFVIEDKLPNEHFRGKISRNEDISQVLKVLELNGINLKIEGREIIIKP